MDGFTACLRATSGRYRTTQSAIAMTAFRADPRAGATADAVIAILDRHHHGDIILFVPPPSPLLETHFGKEPKPFGKVVSGVPGDVVSRKDRAFFVNGRQVATAKPMSRRGETLALGPTGTVPKGCYFVTTPHKDSFDSRYAAIGWVCRSRILGVGRPIL